jgi:archaellum component FlaC
MSELYQVLEKLGSIQAKLDNQGEDIKEIKSKVESHETLKNRVIGLCVAVSAGVGITASQAINSLKSIFTHN